MHPLTKSLVHLSLLLPVALSFGQDGDGPMPITLPLARDNFDRYYEPVKPVDLGTAAGAALTGNRMSPLTLTACDDREGAPTGIRATVKWGTAESELSGFELVSEEFSEPVPNFALWAKFEGTSSPLWLRLTDASGERFQYVLRSTRTRDGWDFYVTQQPATNHNGGNGDGVLDLPYKLNSLVMVEPLDFYEGTTSVCLSGLELMRQIREPQAENPITFALPRANVGQVYAPGETVGLIVSNAKASGWSVVWTLVDYQNQPLGNGSVTLPEEGAALIEVTPADPGYYVLKLAVDSPDGLVDTYDFRFAVIAERAPQRVDWDVPPYFGMCTHYDHWDHDSIPLLARYGVQVQRMDFLWRMAETSKGVYHFPVQVDAAVETALAEGVQSQGIINYGNPIYENPSYRNGTFPTTDPVRAAYAAYARATVEHFQGPLRVQYFEVWNEWTYGCGMRPDRKPLPGNTAENYVKLLKAAYPVIKAGNPQARVIGIGGDNPWSHKKDVVEMLKLGVLDYCDAISLHPYRQPDTPEYIRDNRTDMYSEIKAICDMMDAYDPTGTKKLWLTEFGWPTWSGRGGVSERDQTRFLVRSYVMMRSLPRVENLTWYDLKDDGDNIWDNQEHNFGLLLNENYNYAPKPAAVAYAVLADMLTGADYIEREESAPEVYRYAFALADGRLMTVAWTTKDHATADFDLNGSLGVIDMMGRTLQTLSGDSPVSLTLSPDPIYLIEED